jgi:hypothetical protein
MNFNDKKDRRIKKLIEYLKLCRSSNISLYCHQIDHVDNKRILIEASFIFPIHYLIT